MPSSGYTTQPPPKTIGTVASADTPQMREFCSRFEASMIRRAGQETFSDGCKVSDYAEETAPAYWATLKFRLLGPEKCAESDMRYWFAI